MYVVTVDSTSGEILDTRDGTREEIYSEFWGRDEYRQCLDREWSRFLASLYACKGFMSQETTMGNHRSFPADIATPTEADITEEMAVNIANVELLQNIGLTQKQANETKASFVLMREEEPYVYAWIVTYCLHKEDKIFSVIIDSSVGSILDTHYGSSDEIRMRFEDEKKVSFHDWTLRKQALWSTLFDCPSIGIFNVLPTEEAVTEEEVLEIAVRWLNYEYGETEDSLSKYHVSFSFYETFPEPLSFMDWVLSIFLSDSNDSPPSSSYYWYIHFCDLSDEWGLYPAYDLPVYTVIVDADGKGFYGINTDWRAKNLVYNDALPD